MTTTPEPEVAKKKGWLRRAQEWLATVESPLTRLKLLFGVIASAAFFIYVWFARSRTSVTFGSSDENYIHVHISNKGPEASTLRSVRLGFPDLPINETLLDLSHADQEKGKSHIPAADIDFAHMRIIPAGVDLALIVPGLIPKVRPGLTAPKLDSMVPDGHAILYVDVQESNDRGEERHVRSDTFSAEEIHLAISKKVWFRGRR